MTRAFCTTRLQSHRPQRSLSFPTEASARASCGLRTSRDIPRLARCNANRTTWSSVDATLRCPSLQNDGVLSGEERMGCWTESRHSLVRSKPSTKKGRARFLDCAWPLSVQVQRILMYRALKQKVCRFIACPLARHHTLETLDSVEVVVGVASAWRVENMLLNLKLCDDMAH